MSERLFQEEIHRKLREDDQFQRLIIAVRGLANERLSHDEIEDQALLIYSMNHSGRFFEEMTRSLPSQIKARKALDDIQNKAAALRKAIESLHERLADDLTVSGAKHLHLIPAELAELESAAQEARAEMLDQYKSNGRPMAECVWVTTLGAAEAYTFVTGCRASYTTVPATNRITGPWPDFLGEVFVALGVAASAERQALDFVKENKCAN